MTSGVSLLASSEILRTYEGDGCRLSICYRSTKEGYAFKHIKDVDGRKISLSFLWINGLPAQYLNNFCLSLLPEPTFGKGRSVYKIENTSGEEIHCLSTDNWKWLNNQAQPKQITTSLSICENEQESTNLNTTDEHLQKTKMRRVYVYVEVDNNPIPIRIPAISDLQVEGIKKCVRKRLYERWGKDFTEKIEKPFKAWQLFYEEQVLSNEKTLGASGIKNLATLQLKTKNVLIPQANLQIFTGGTRHDAKQFKDYSSVMQKRMKLVCKICCENDVQGTGFLIGKSHVMTNAHVSQIGLKGGKAIFFYESGENEIEVNLIEEKSSSPHRSDNRVPITQDTLDFSIIYFTYDNLPREKQDFIDNLVEDACSFFKPNKKSKKALRQERANIIQHAQGKLKSIAFRDNQITSAEKFFLHYKSYTSSGSSGSPVIDDSGAFLGLHFSACNEIHRVLFEKVDELVKKLEEAFEISFKKSGDTYRFKRIKEVKWVQISCSGEIQGTWKYRGDPKDLRDLVIYAKLGHLNVNAENYEDIEKWLNNFLKEVYPDNESDQYIKHIFCNTAIPANRIFEYLNDKDPGLLTFIEHESEQLMKNLEDKETTSLEKKEIGQMAQQPEGQTANLPSDSFSHYNEEKQRFLETQVQELKHRQEIQELKHAHDKEMLAQKLKHSYEQQIQESKSTHDKEMLAQKLKHAYEQQIQESKNYKICAALAIGGGFLGFLLGYWWSKDQNTSSGADAS